jgi:hypothetical protein
MSQEPDSTFWIVAGAVLGIAGVIAVAAVLVLSFVTGTPA